MKVLVTGSSGKTGYAIIKAFVSRGLPVSAFVHRKESIEEMRTLGVSNFSIGDLADEYAINDALQGVDAVYLILPNMTPNESEICCKIINSCKLKGINRVVYHSVLHPQASKMPHHWQKLMVEEQLLSSSLDFTILQPTAYMQNILGYKKAIDTGIYPMPYPPSSRISLVDLNDIAEVATIVLTEKGHSNAIYELVGTAAISQTEIAEALSNHTRKQIKAIETSLIEWRENAIKSKMPEYMRDTLLSMFEYYRDFGLKGNSNVLEYLLNRKPTSLEQFLKRDYII